MPASLSLDALGALYFALLTGKPVEPADESAVIGWVEAARRGDPAAQTCLYNHFMLPVFRAVRPMCCSETDAEDIVQDAFVRAFAKIDQYQALAGKRFVSWLLAIACNLGRKRIAASRRLLLGGRPLDEAPDAAVPSQDEDVFQRELRQALSVALAHEDERDRTIICLRYGGGLTAEEVSAAVGLQPANVRKICERSRQRLLRRLSSFASANRPER